SLAHAVEAEPLPGFRRALDDEGAVLVVEAVRVAPHPAGVRPDEGEGEGVEDLVSAEPDVRVAALADSGREVVFMEFPDTAVDAVAADDHVRAGKLRE